MNPSNERNFQESPVDPRPNGKARMEEGESAAMKSISEAYSSAVDWIRKNPLPAAALGAGAGFLLGAIVRRIGADR